MDRKLDFPLEPRWRHSLGLATACWIAAAAVIRLGFPPADGVGLVPPLGLLAAGWLLGGFRLWRGAWVREGEHWRHVFAIEVARCKRICRKVMPFASLEHSELLTGDEASATRPLTGFDVYKHTYLPFGRGRDGTVIVDRPEDLEALAQVWINRLDSCLLYTSRCV